MTEHQGSRAKHQGGPDADPAAAELTTAFEMALTGWFRNSDNLDSNTREALRFLWDAGRAYDEVKRAELADALKARSQAWHKLRHSGPFDTCALSCQNDRTAIEAAS